MNPCKYAQTLYPSFFHSYIVKTDRCWTCYPLGFNVHIVSSHLSEYGQIYFLQGLGSHWLSSLIIVIVIVNAFVCVYIGTLDRAWILYFISLHLFLMYVFDFIVFFLLPEW